MMTSDLFVWIHLPGDEAATVAGRLRIKDSGVGASGEFVYGKSYLGNARAIPLDPVSLPLRGGARIFSALGGFPSAILDAGPDRWGIKVINRMLGAQAFPEGYLLINDPGRIGALAFSLGADMSPVELSSRTFNLGDLLSAAEAVERDEDVDPELLKALSPGTGGARPKCNLVDEDGVWIAKFPSVDDPPEISIPRLEHAIMLLAADCGLDVAETRLRVVDGKDVCLVRRFDREVIGGKVCRRAALSARTVFHGDPAYAQVETGSYGRFSRWLPRFGGDAAQSMEIFRRMVFNCLVRNVDDHELNHAIVHVEGERFKLAPAFDIVPTLRPDKVCRHALLIGDSAAGSIENLISNAAAFRLSRGEALEIVHSLQRDVLAKWRDAFYTAGFGDEIDWLAGGLFKPLPERTD